MSSNSAVERESLGGKTFPANDDDDASGILRFRNPPADSAEWLPPVISLVNWRNDWLTALEIRLNTVAALDVKLIINQTQLTIRSLSSAQSLGTAGGWKRKRGSRVAGWSKGKHNYFSDNFRGYTRTPFTLILNVSHQRRNYRLLFAHSLSLFLFGTGNYLVGVNSPPTISTQDLPQPRCLPLNGVQRQSSGNPEVNPVNCI